MPGKPHYRGHRCPDPTVSAAVVRCNMQLDKSETSVQSITFEDKANATEPPEVSNTMFSEKIVTLKSCKSRVRRPTRLSFRWRRKRARIPTSIQVQKLEESRCCRQFRSANRGSISTAVRSRRVKRMADGLYSTQWILYLRGCPHSRTSNYGRRKW